MVARNVKFWEVVESKELLGNYVVDYDGEGEVVFLASSAVITEVAKR